MEKSSFLKEKREKKTSSYYSKFQSLASLYTNSASPHGESQKSKPKPKLWIQKYLYPEIFSSYISKFQSLASLYTNSASPRGDFYTMGAVDV